MEEEECKVILLGDTSVGKTSIARRQAHGVFDFKMVSTVGVDRMTSPVQIEGRTVKLMLWDTAGQERFASLIPMDVRGARACVLVASLVDPDSCEHMERWVRLLRQSREDPPVIAAINKTDLVDGAPMTEDEIKTKYGKMFPRMFFVSARTGDSILPLFQLVGICALKHKLQGNDQSRKPVAAESGRSGCC
jgi:Ras-related protein Rab-6A